jgi:hypothetical protein
MSETYTELNPGSGGDVFDEELVVGFPVAPTERKRERVQIAGASRFEIARVINVAPDGSEYAVVTRNIASGIQSISLPGTPIVEFGTVAGVPANTETTVASYVVPALKVFYGMGFIASGDVDGRYVFYIDATAKIAARSSVAEPTSNIDFKFVSPTASAGQTVTIKATHYATGITAEFEATILGYLVDV